MSRYKKTMREALEEVQQNMAFEGKMKDIYTMQQTGASPKEIAKKMGLPLSTVKDILGEEHTISEFTRKDFDRNEDENEHTLNSYMLAKKYGDSSEKSKMTRLYNKTRKVGSYLTKAENDFVTMIQSKYYRRLREELRSKKNLDGRQNQDMEMLKSEMGRKGKRDMNQDQQFAMLKSEMGRKGAVDSKQNQEMVSMKSQMGRKKRLDNRQSQEIQAIGNELRRRNGMSQSQEKRLRASAMTDQSQNQALQDLLNKVSELNDRTLKSFESYESHSFN